MPKQFIDGKEYTRGFLGRTGAPMEGEAIMLAAAMVESQNTGRWRWRTAKVYLTDANCADPDVNSHADWLLREADQDKVRVVDRRSRHA